MVCDDRCVDTANDDDNCGSCGQACGPTSTCVRGLCTPAVVEVVAARRGCGSLDLAINAGALYFADAGHGQIVRTSAGTDAPGWPITIAESEVAPSTIVTRGTSVFWIGGGKKQIRRGALAQTPVTVATSVTDIHGLAVTPDAETVYFSTGNSVMRVPASGGGVVEAARELSDGVPMALALDGDQLAYPNDFTKMISVVTPIEGELATCNEIDGANAIFVGCLRVAQGQGSLLLERIDTWSGRVLWANGSAIRSARTTGSLFDVEQFLVAATLLDPVTGFVATSNLVAFSSNDPNDHRSGEILQAGLEPYAPAVRLARGLEAPRALATDGVRVFWATGDCSIQATPLILP